jgi:hypothetical protein
MTPYETQILIACCVSATPAAYFPPETALCASTLEWMRTEGLIDEGLHATDRARAWLEAALKTPLPVQIWVIPEHTES